MLTTIVVSPEVYSLDCSLSKDQVNTRVSSYSQSSPRRNVVLPFESIDEILK